MYDARIFVIIVFREHSNCIKSNGNCVFRSIEINAPAFFYKNRTAITIYASNCFRFGKNSKDSTKTVYMQTSTIPSLWMRFPKHIILVLFLPKIVRTINNPQHSNSHECLWIFFYRIRLKNVLFFCRSTSTFSFLEA